MCPQIRKQANRVREKRGLRPIVLKGRPGCDLSHARELLVSGMEEREGIA
jgi:hypothetical protein